jgi:Bardet-Biedl syndrome 9 protein
MKGVLVLLSGTGELQCCYLGTEPALFVAPPLEVYAIDFEQAGKELSELQKVIKAYTKKSGKAVWTVIKNVLEDSGLQKVISC